MTWIFSTYNTTTFFRYNYGYFFRYNYGFYMGRSDAAHVIY